MKPVFNVAFSIRKFKVSINILIFAVIPAAFIFKALNTYLLTLAFILIHEAGHILAAVISGAKVFSIRFLPVGLNAEIDEAACSKGHRIFIYAAGPCSSFILALLFFVFDNCAPGYHIAKIGTFTNLWLGVFNLLPVLPLDGGKLVMELLSSRFGVFRTGKKLQLVSVLLSLTIILIGLNVMGNSNKNPSLILIGIYILMCISGVREEAAFMNIKNFVFRRSRIIRKGIYPVREIVVLKHVKISDVIKAMDYIDRFHIINVLDEDFRVIKVMTEQEILDAVIENSPDTTFDKLI